MTRIPLRLRLSLAFAAAVAVLLAVVGVFQYQHLADDLSQALDLQLRQGVQNLMPLVTRTIGHATPLAGSGLVENGESFAEVVDSRGAVVDAQSSLRGAALLSPAEFARARHSATFLNRPSVPGLDEPARLLAVPIAHRGQTWVLIVGATAQNRAEALATLRTELLIGAPITLMLTSGGGYLLAGAALRPVESMRRRAASITARDPGQRLPIPPSSDELSRLGETLNDMLSRLEQSIERERSFLADAAHELRTPLAALRTELELALRHHRPASDLRLAVESAAEETERLTRLADDLLLIARADQGQLPIHLTTVDTNELMHRVLRGVRRQDGRSISIDSDGVRQFSGDPLRLEQALRNMVDNALRHGAGDVSLAAVQTRTGIELHVRDHGAGMPDEFLARAFDRFSRAAETRGRPGAGLGLSIVQAVATAHGGRASAQNIPGDGLDVWLSIPHNAEPADGTAGDTEAPKPADHLA